MSTTVCVVGSNNSGELGVSGDVKQLTNLTTLKSDKIDIDSVHFGYEFTIFCNKDFTNIHAAGTNDAHQCSAIAVSDIPFSAINYFNSKGIKIKKVYVNITGDSLFWLTDDNKVFGSGSNNHTQLGNGKDDITPKEPVFIPDLINVIDIKSAMKYSLALCATNNKQLNMIAVHWARYYHAPIDIAGVIIIFARYNTVYSTCYSEYGGNAREPYCTPLETKWTEIEAFKEKDIMKIAVGESHSLFLESNGRLWSCGSNSVGALGHGEDYVNDDYKPKEIKYFIDNDIKIMDMKCGEGHNLALDYDGNVYGWGRNVYYQCGYQYDTFGEKNIYQPKLIEFFKDFKVVEIGCGYFHSFCRTQDGKVFLFGYNIHNECTLNTPYNNLDVNTKAMPTCINQVIEDNFKNIKIQQVVLGCGNTAVILKEE